MTKLSAREIDLLKRVDDKEELRPLFFKKVKGLKWFDSISERGYFNPEENPRPKPSNEEGYFTIPYWPVIDYLVNTVSELEFPENSEYVSKYLELLVNITNYAKDNGFSNYRTWQQFSKIISSIPSTAINLDDIDIIDYWLDDKYNRNLVAQELGEEWLPQLLDTNDSHNFQIATKLIDKLFQVDFIEKEFAGRINRESRLRIDKYNANRIINKVAYLAGMKLGKESVLIFDSRLKYILGDLNNDLWSHIWHPSIGQDQQNNYKDNAENLMIEAYRDSLNGYINANPLEASHFIENLFDSDYQTIHRIALLAVNENFYLFPHMIDKLVNDNFLTNNYRHEMWNFLNRNYPQFNTEQKQKLISLINEISRTDNDGNLREGATAYNKAIWFAAIKDHGEEELSQYKKNTAIAKTEPVHPDLTMYTTAGFIGHKSPIPIEELQSLSLDKLVEELNTYEDPGDDFEAGMEGLVKAFNQTIKASPVDFSQELSLFANIDLAYIHEIIEAYRDLWNEKTKLPWDDIWSNLIDFCIDLIKQERFWESENSKPRDNFIANRYWIVSAIGRLIEAGTKTDDHAFDIKYLHKAEILILQLLEKELGVDFKYDSDAVFISINSPRGICLEALINLALRSCRIADKSNSNDHLEAWKHFQPYFDEELSLADNPKPEYEFATLVSNYIPNFLYMSQEWVFDNLKKIFNQDNYQRWLCAIQGFSLVNTVYQEIYSCLKENGDFIKALNDKNLSDHVWKKIIQNIVVAYINDYEKYPQEDSLIRCLIIRNNLQEINHLIWFIWTLRKEKGETLKEKVYELWPNILSLSDLSTKDGRKVASQLCFWSVFVDEINDHNRNFLHAIAPYADQDHNSYLILENIANISQNQPFEAYDLWMKLLEGSWQDFPVEAVRESLSNLVNLREPGIRKAKDIVSEYLKKGIERPNIILREILQNN